MAKDNELNPVDPVQGKMILDEESLKNRLKSMIESANNQSKGAVTTGFDSDSNLAQVDPAPGVRVGAESKKQNLRPAEGGMPLWEDMSSHPSKTPAFADNANKALDSMINLNDYLNLSKLDVNRQKPSLNFNSHGSYGSGNVQTKTAIYSSSMGGVVEFSPVSVATFPQIIARMVALGFNWGYQYTPGMSITRSDSPWYLTISRHGYNDTLSANPERIANLIAAGESGLISKALAPLPSYYINSMNQMKPSYFNFSSMAPCMGCEIDLGEPRMSRLDLFRGQSMDVPDGFAVGSPSIKLQMVDDEKGSLRKYLMDYQRRCYDLKSNAVASWRDVVFDIDILILRPGPEVDYHYTFYCVLQNFDYRFQLEKDGVGDLNTVYMPFSIVGAADSRDIIYGTSAPSFVNISGALPGGKPTLTMKDISVFRTRSGT